MEAIWELLTFEVQPLDAFRVPVTSAKDQARRHVESPVLNGVPTSLGQLVAWSQALDHQLFLAWDASYESSFLPELKHPNLRDDWMMMNIPK